MANIVESRLKLQYSALRSNELNLSSRKTSSYVLLQVCES